VVDGGAQTQSSASETTEDGSTGASVEMSGRDHQAKASLLTVPQGSGSVAQPQTSGPQAVVRSASPTLRALQDAESGTTASQSHGSATCQPLKDGEEIRYQGYTNPHKQSRSFKMLEQGLRLAESAQQGA